MTRSLRSTPSPSRRRRHSLGAVVVVWTALGGCAQLDTYDTGTDAEYVGQIFGADQDGCADLARCSFIRRGFGGETVLRLRFNADDVQGIAGSLSTEGENCGPTLTDVPLVAIEPLLHDQLGLYEIPGGARVKNFIFSVSPVSGPLSGRDVVAFVSLVRSDRVEVRLLAGSGQNACDPTDCGQINAGGCDYFGVFSLRRAER